MTPNAVSMKTAAPLIINVLQRMLQLIAVSPAMRMSSRMHLMSDKGVRSVRVCSRFPSALRASANSSSSKWEVASNFPWNKQRNTSRVEIKESQHLSRNPAPLLLIADKARPNRLELAVAVCSGVGWGAGSMSTHTTLHLRKALQGLAASGHPFRVSFRATAQARSPCSCRKCVPLAEIQKPRIKQ
jgi:hypothetical protein